MGWLVHAALSWWQNRMTRVELEAAQANARALNRRQARLLAREARS